MPIESDLPGAELVGPGLEDLSRGVASIPALLVALGAPRLRRAGLDVPHVDWPEPEKLLYTKLAESGEDAAHFRYNALIRRLVSFERAIDPKGFRAAVEAILGA